MVPAASANFLRVGAPVPRKRELAPQEVFHAVWQRRWVVVWTLLLCVAGAVAYLKFATPVYTASSRLYVVPDLPDSAAQIGWRERSKNYLSTQCELLKSTPILGPVAELPDVKAMKTFAGADAVLPALKDELAVELGTRDDLIELSLDSTDPREAARVVNAVVESYVAYQGTQKRTSAVEMLKILRREKEVREQELADQRRAVLTFKQENGLLPVQNDGGIVLQGLSQLAEAKATAQLQVTETGAAFETLRAALSDPTKRRAVAAAIANDGAPAAVDRGRAALQSELYQFELKLATAQHQLAPQHPTILGLREAIAQTQNRLAEFDLEVATAHLVSLEQSWLAAKRRLESVSKVVEDQQQKALELNATAASLAVLESGAQQAQKLVEGIETRIRELSVGGETGALNVTVLEPAIADDKPSKPRKPLVLVAAGLLGLIAGSFLAFVRASTDRRLRSSEQIEDALGVPVLSAVPQVKSRRGAAGFAPGSEAGDAYRTIRAAIHFGSRGRPIKTLVVTSAAKGEGKSTLATNVAIAMAQAGERTLLIDADLRRPSLHKRFNVVNSAGLSTVRYDAGKPDANICTTAVPRLDLLPSGPIPSNPAALLSSQRFEALLTHLAGRYDRIVLDTPPVLGMPDALILGAVCDVTLLVVRADVSDRRATEAAFAALVNMGVRSLATVVNGVRRQNGYSRYVRGYHVDERQTSSPDDSCDRSAQHGATPVNGARGGMRFVGEGVASPDGVRPLEVPLTDRLLPVPIMTPRGES